MLVIFRPEAVQPILDADPAFYRPNGEDDLAAVLRAVNEGHPGELAGYGARTAREPDSVQVTIHSPDAALIYMSFFAFPDRAEIFAMARLQDIADYLQVPVAYSISPR